MSFTTGDQVYDVEFMCFGRVLAIHGIWAWIELNDAEPNERPVATRVDRLSKRKPLPEGDE